ncbi:MAG: lysylphosphatidylglycerol synthase transmembrane domain-containing protein [Bacteroidota bacterium]
MKIKGILRIVLFMVIGIVILWLVTRNQNFEKIWTEFKNANFWWVLVSVLSGVISHYIRALRWNLLIQSMNYKTRTDITFCALLTGYLANLVVPRLGEVTRCATLSRYSKIPFNALAGTVVAERVLDMITLLLLIFLTVMFQFQFLRDFLSHYIFEPLLLLLDQKIWVMLLLLIITGVLFFVARNFYLKSKSLKTGWIFKIRRLMSGFIKGLDSIRQLGKKGLFYGYTVLIWFFYLLMVYFVFFAFGSTSHLGIDAGFTILSMGSLGIVAPVPGGIGTYHFIVIKTLTELYHITLESATSYAYIAHGSQTLILIFIGGFAYFYLGWIYKKRLDNYISQDEQK